MRKNTTALHQRDKDQDTTGHNCAEKRKGGGWFAKCNYHHYDHAHLTGLLTSSSRRLPDDKQIHWYYGGNRGRKLDSWKEVEMKLVEEPWVGHPGKSYSAR